jgi:hypothetical protein
MVGSSSIFQTGEKRRRYRVGVRGGSTTVKSYPVWRYLMFEYCYCLVIDGGALNQGSADSAGYGSFRLEARTGQKQTIRLDFGRGVTNWTLDKSSETRFLVTKTEVSARIM